MIDLSTDQLTFHLAANLEDGPDTLALPELPSWLVAGMVPLFSVFVGAQNLTARTPGAMFGGAQTVVRDGARVTDMTFSYPFAGLEVIHHVVVYEGSPLVEAWQTVRNVGSTTVVITRLDSLALDLVPANYDIFAFTSAWGDEFEGGRTPVAQLPLLETRAGRSSQGRHPWFALFRPDGAILAAAVAWSGNWVFRFDQGEDLTLRLSGGLHDWQFEHTLSPGSAVESPPVVVALGKDADLNSVSIEYARVGRRHWYPHNTLSRQLPVEWNHWWSYEDRNINEEVFRANVDVAARLGMEVCTLDAGWFGPTDADSHWYDYRGDWANVNTIRFPSGLRALSDYVHGRGMAFGLWCEIESLGQHAQLAEQHTEFVATRDGERLGYLCFGNPAVQEWALHTLRQLIDAYRLDWIKLDFNLDPGAGCDRADHCHSAGDGLYAHYQGYYQTLERLRGHHPEVILENCSSGGLRIDLGIMRRTLPTFLSDPDWPEHGLQLIWGASMMLAPSAWLHWGWSEWINGYAPQTFNPRNPELKQHQLDYYTRIGMLGAFGLSHKLPELPPWVAERYAMHIQLYRTTLRRFIGEADFYRLTEQPRRGGRGDLWAAFQYVLPGDAEHLVAVFRLPGGATERTLQLYRLDPEREYTLTWLQSERVERQPGRELLLQGLRCADLPEEGSALVLLS